MKTVSFVLFLGVNLFWDYDWGWIQKIRKMYPLYSCCLITSKTGRNILYVSFFAITSVRNIFLADIRQDRRRKTFGFHVNSSLKTSNVNENWNGSTDFRNLSYMKFHENPSCEWLVFPFARPDAPRDPNRRCERMRTCLNNLTALLLSHTDMDCPHWGGSIRVQTRAGSRTCWNTNEPSLCVGS